MERAGNTTDPGAGRPTREMLVERAEALVPTMQQRAEEGERLRRCPDETIRDFIAGDLLRICQPARYGGFELGYDVLCEVSQTLARGCGSQAWVHMVFADNALKLSSYTLEAQHEVWGEDPVARLSNAVAPVGKGRPVDGGVLWTGRHGFSSGVDHAGWVMASGYIERGDQRQACSVLIPRSDITIVDDWHVLGLAGSGSKTFVVDGAFVPEHRILDKAAADEGRAPGNLHYTAPVARLPRGGVSAVSFTAVVVGIAEGFLQEYYEFTGPRLSRGTVVAEQMGTQISTGVSAAEVEAAVRMYLGSIRETMRTLERGEALSRHDQVGGKRNAAYAAQLALSAVQRLFNAAGGRALYLNNELQRKFRDVHAAAAHHSLVWDSAAASYGRHVLGMYADGSRGR